MSCSYCYVPRRKGYANPITTFVNIDQIGKAIARHAQRQGPKLEANQVDPRYWVYDIGENSDCSVDAAISDNIRDLVTLFKQIGNAKATFATKWVNRNLLNYDPQGKTRIRFSLMPQHIAKVVDVRTSPIADRIGAINDFVDAGYEVHLNFSPVIYYEGWRDDYADLFQHVDAVLSPHAKAQLKAEVIFLTHNEQLHDVNLRWHPKAEEWLWRPDLQEAKVTTAGDDVVRYRHGWKGKLVSTLRTLLARDMPYCTIRYAF
jgi:spore photoproduct lyase family protein